MAAAFLQPHPVLFESQFLIVFTHGALFAAGALAGVGVLRAAARRLGLPTEKILPGTAAVFICGLLAARIGFLLAYWEPSDSLLEAVTYWHGGLVSYWGIAGGLAAGWWLVRKESRGRQRDWLEAAVLAGLAAWAVGRWGNYWAYESYGVVSPAWNGFYGRVPIQLFESLACTMLAVIGWTRLGKIRVAPWLLLGYFSARTVIDFWRDEGSVIGIHYSQLVSGIIAMALAVYLIVLHARKGR